MADTYRTIQVEQIRYNCSVFIWILRNGRKLNLEENVVKKNEKGNKCDFVIVPEIITVICTSYSIYVTV